MKLGAKEKISYGLGAVGKDMVYMLSASYILYYYQDILGVSAIAMGIILMAARVFDAFNDPIMGVVVAKTKTKWGKFRPWLLIGTLTNAVILFLMFSAPASLDGKGLVAYAAVFYILWGVTYTMMDIPYWSMVPAFTESGKERENLSAMARSCAGVGSALVTIFTVMIVSMLGGMFAGKLDAEPVKYTSEANKIGAYAVLLDDDGNKTSEMTEFEAGKNSLTVSISGPAKIFDGVTVEEDGSEYSGIINVSSSNASVDYEINGIKADEGNAEFVTDSKGSTAVLVLNLAKEDYEKVKGADGLSGSVTMESKIEVERVGFKYFSLIVGILFVIFILITCINIKEKSSVEMQTASVGQMFKALVQNDQAMTIVITIVLVNSATYITSNLLIYFFKYDLAGNNWQGNYTLFNTFAGGIQILAMMLFFPLLRKVFNTLKIFYICIFSAVGGYIILLSMALAGVGTVVPFFVPGFFIMGAVGILNVIVTVFLANTVDYGELKNHRRDESVIFSMQTFVVKLASGIAALVASICLAIFNIQSSSSGAVTVGKLRSNLEALKTGADTAINNLDLIGLRLVMTLTPIFVLLAALLVFKTKYKLNDKKLEEITAELKQRREAEGQ